MIKLTPVPFALALMLSGCATGPSYQEQLSARPLPQNSDTRLAECAYIRDEIARMNSLNRAAPVMASNAMMAAAFQAKGSRNVAALESRAARIGCGAAFSDGAGTPRKSDIEACISACKDNTSRSPEQCFDDCNK